MHISIFDTFNGLPFHPLVVHAAVIVTPVAALLALALVRPSWRQGLRWPAAGAVALAWVLVWVTRESGEALQKAIPDQLRGDAGKALDVHIQLADKLNYVLFTLLVVVVLFAWLLPKLARPAGAVGAVVIAVLALMTIGLVAQTGEQGAKTVWNPTGAQSYTVD